MQFLVRSTLADLKQGTTAMTRYCLWPLGGQTTGSSLVSAARMVRPCTRVWTGRPVRPGRCGVLFAAAIIRFQKNTNWMCRRCGMPLCKKNRGRDQTCLEEHQCSAHPILGCGCEARTRYQWIMPDELKCYRIIRK